MSILNSTKNYLLNKSGVQQHFDENEILRAAADKGLISNELYNKMGGFNFKENVPYAGNLGTGLGSGIYNITQSVLSDQPVSEIFGDVARNYMGAAGGLTKEEKDLYDNILGKREPAFNLTSAAGKVKDAFGNFIFTPAGAGSDVVNLPSVDITDELDRYYEEGEMMDNVVSAPEDGIFAAIRDKLDPETFLNLISNFYGGNIKQSLASAGIGKTFRNMRDAIGTRLGPSPYGTSQTAFDAMTPLQQQAVGSIYGQGGIMSGYNPVSAFGRGPAGAIQNRIDNILGRDLPQTAASRAKVRDLRTALTNVGGGDGGADTFDTSNIDEAGNYQDDLDPGQTE